MEIKKEDDARKSLCSACLSVGRALHNISTDEKLNKYYFDILDDIPNAESLKIECFKEEELSMVTKVPLNICEECRSLLQKCLAFQEQVKQSYQILLNQKNVPEQNLSQKQSYLEIFVPVLEENVYNDLSNKRELKPEVKVELKRELKDEIECLDSDNADNYEASESFEDPKTIEKELETIVKSIERNEKKKNNLKTKLKKTNKMVNNLKFNKTKRVKGNANIVSMLLSYEEMLDERQKDSKRKSYVRAEYKCENCLIGFNYKKSFEAHLAAKHSPHLGEYICPICKTVISSVDSFTTHYKRHLKRYECNICKKRTIDKKVLQQHYITKHGGGSKEYICNICGKISNTIDTHRYHRDTHKARVQCPECEKTFRHRAGLMNHRLTVHKYNNVFPCTVCDKVFRWKTSLKRHQEKHDLKGKSPPTARCDMCEVTFSSICSYQRHLKNSLKHVTQDQLKFICDHCGKRFADKTKLRDHIEEKHLHKSYQCHICLKPSKNRVGLDQHIRNVHKGRPNDKICNYCGKGFPTRTQLDSHIRTHTGERPFICEYCPTTFSQQSNLYKHKRQVHMNIKSKRYSLCKKRKEDTEAPAIENVFNLTDAYRPMIQYSPDRFVI